MVRIMTYVLDKLSGKGVFHNTLLFSGRMLGEYRYVINKSRRKLTVLSLSSFCLLPDRWYRASIAGSVADQECRAFSFCAQCPAGKQRVSSVSLARQDLVDKVPYLAGLGTPNLSNIRRILLGSITTEPTHTTTIWHQSSRSIRILEKQKHFSSNQGIG